MKHPEEGVTEQQQQQQQQQQQRLQTRWHGRGSHPEDEARARERQARQGNRQEAAGGRSNRVNQRQARLDKFFHAITDRSRNGQRPGLVWQETAAFTPVHVWDRLFSTWLLMKKLAIPSP
ncbi:hypothetical protein B0A52_05956 [Exophiala mesophila]|uniref:Uncharacterized protein n=1 Tax=Exophiala mesophila TaxID=212818 RepID=A0A438N4I9_EXOME|nr:hypothetical protein B0A52_05956 [Exophiala mesophila]